MTAVICGEDSKVNGLVSHKVMKFADAIHLVGIGVHIVGILVSTFRLEAFIKPRTHFKISLLLLLR